MEVRKRYSQFSRTFFRQAGEPLGPTLSLCPSVPESVNDPDSSSPVGGLLSRTLGGTLRSSDGDGGFHKPRFWCPNLWKQWTLTKLMTPG